MRDGGLVVRVCGTSGQQSDTWLKACAPASVSGLKTHPGRCYVGPPAFMGRGLNGWLDSKLPSQFLVRLSGKRSWASSLQGQRFERLVRLEAPVSVPSEAFP
eukprot:1151007-Pelagomonas_calceolata.AAC.5